MKEFITTVFFIASAVFLYLGFDKMFNYSNSELSYDKKVNVYVGGDAYNYIINSNYSTAYFVLATFFGLAAIGFLILIAIDKNKEPKVIEDGLLKKKEI